MGVSGVEIQAAIKKAATWGTEVVCGANDGVLLMADTLRKVIESYPDDSLGNVFTETRDLGEIKVEGELPAYLRYEGLDLLIALAMGATGGAPVQQAATAAYKQTFTLANTLDGIFATLAIKKGGVNVMAYPGVKVTGFTITGEMGKPLEITFAVVADNEDPASATNTSGTFANVTYRDKANRVLMSQAAVRINAQSGSALASPGDVVKPSKFKLEYKRNLKGAYLMGNINKIDEPLTEGQPEITLTLEFARYTATTYLTGFSADTAYKADIVFTGSLIESTYYRTLSLLFPHLRLKSVEAVSAEGQIVHPLVFEAHYTATAPSGMTGINEPFQAELTNRITSNVLA